MAEWAKVYQLIEKASSFDVWECIVKTLQDSIGSDISITLPEKNPDSFFYQKDGILLDYHEEPRWSFCHFSQQTEEDTSELQIIFDKKTHGDRDTIHHNLYFFAVTNKGQLILHFFKLLKNKNLVSKKQTRISVKEIKHSSKKSHDNSGLKILFIDNREVNLLREVEHMTEQLWFLGAEDFYTGDELDYIRSFLESAPEIKEIGPPKLQEKFLSKESIAKAMDSFPDFESLQQYLQPTVSVIFGERKLKIELDNEQVADLADTLIELVYELKQEEFSKEFHQKFSDFLDKYPEQDFSDIRQKAILNVIWDGARNYVEQFHSRPDQLKKHEQSQEISVPQDDYEQKLQESSQKIEQQQKEIESLNSQIRTLEKEKQEEIKKLQIKIDSLQEQLESQNTTRTKEQNEARSGVVELKIPCPVNNNFPNEIEDYLYKLLYSTIEAELGNIPKNKDDEQLRKRDVLQAVMEKKVFNWEKSETSQKVEQLKNLFKSSASPSSNDLKSIGFIKIPDTQKHHKYYFYEECYQITFPSTPSDSKSGSENLITDIKFRFFLTLN